ncbi:MAG: hypothetical protein M1828_004825 [Chrysothrix sp. TS-e1954]|nr:MAG: hypothetical protein M1828_004825 [Chrysothrix sp. TS-e1954]
MSSHRILVFGAGGIGGVYSYILSRANAVVTAVCRSNYEVVRRDGIAIDSKLWGKVHVRPHVVSTVAEVAEESWDFVVVCAKAFPDTAGLIREAIGPSTAIILAQNGIGIEEDYEKLYPGNPIISGVVYLPTTQTEPGVIRMGDLEKLKIGTYPANANSTAKQRLSEFADLFRAAGASAEVYEDIQAERWQKLLVNASWNPVCALTRNLDTDFLRSTEGEAEGFIVKLMTEVASIAQHAGYKEINHETINYQVSRNVARLRTEGVEPSMLTDVKHGRRLEHEAIIGNAVKIARRLEVQTPILDTIRILIRGLDASIMRNQ